MTPRRHPHTSAVCSAAASCLQTQEMNSKGKGRGSWVRVCGSAVRAYASMQLPLC